MSAQAIDVMIAGQAYKLAVAPENEAALREAVALVDSKMSQLKANAGNKGQERIAVMTAISLASDLLSSRAASSAAPSAENKLADPAIQSKIADMQSQLDGALQEWGVTPIL